MGLNVRFDIADLITMGQAFADGVGANLSVQEHKFTTETEFQDFVSKGVSGPQVLVAVLRTAVVHRTAGAIGAVLVKAYDEAKKTVTCADTNPTKFGIEWTCPVSLLFESCSGEKTGLFSVVTK
eukprot:NODE_422_length_1025_cov_888.856557_g267_i1.p1 GENE.NODE_422_length_1025_cov_888.856557_g267_i1~~NODE_422_length_1025_cov_888.856557_g267_i1.p1  ORF type:complete len:131 (+),score=31.43 NODE_422_length_1025_cov_888.856557_g267_i1:23-394(+)